MKKWKSTSDDATLPADTGETPGLPDDFLPDRHQVYLPKQLTAIIERFRGQRGVRTTVEDAISVYLMVYANQIGEFNYEGSNQTPLPRLVSSNTSVALERLSREKGVPEGAFVRRGTSLYVALETEKKGEESLLEALERSATIHHRKLSEEIVARLRRSLEEHPAEP
jgi:hypothetical protein